VSAWQAVIGLEMHVQLATRRKLFSGAATSYGAEPNAQVGLVDAALPGSLPVPNAEAVRMAVRFGLAVGGRVARRSEFARKNYFYPDLPKGYQISQYEHPIVEGGVVIARLDDGREVRIELIRAHLEEDAGKSLHDAFRDATAIDLNRAGTPLIEVVISPCLHSAAEAAAAMRAVHRLVTWLGICDGNLQEGSFRCDANVSVRRGPDAPLGTRAEIKNVNSFRFVEKAVEYEIERQIRELEAGRPIRQETRLYDETRHQTRTMRGKEEAHDYRYFPDPDLPPLVLSESEIGAIALALPELPDARRERYRGDLGLSDYDADLLTADRPTSDYFEALLAALGAVDPARAKLAANWIAGELASALNAADLSIADSRVDAAGLAGLLAELSAGRVSGKVAKEVFAAMWAGEGTAAAIIEARGFGVIRDDGALAASIEQILAANPKQVAQYRGGDTKVLGWFVGQIMRATRGQADPSTLDRLLKERLGG
jgi:aspartyl-tRNA(Asn)/glutamyl-tRNA(Gln) amidotransferase subunit B